MAGRLVITLDDTEIFSRDVDRVVSEQTGAGLLTLEASFPPPAPDVPDWGIKFHTTGELLGELVTDDNV